MNIDACIVSALYSDTNLQLSDKFRLIGAVGHKFSSFNAPVFDFIEKYFNQYNTLPSIDLVREKYPVFKFITAKDHFKYYLQESLNESKVRSLQETMLRVETNLAAGKLDDAVKCYIEDATKVKLFDVNEADKNIIEDFSSYREAYIQKRDSGQVMGIPTGFDVLDNDTMGFLPGDFWLLVGRPAAGKSWIACHLAVNAAKAMKSREDKILFFSKEMTEPQIRQRIMSILGGFNYDLVRKYKLDNKMLEQLEEKVQQVVGSIIIIGLDFTGKYDVSYIKRKVLEHSPKFAIVDGIYLLAKTPNWEDQTEATREVRSISLNTNVPLLCTTQFAKKQQGNSNMKLENISYSDSYSQDTSVAIGAERIYDDIAERYTNQVKLKSLKNREGEADKIITFTFDFNTSSIVVGDLGMSESFTADKMVEKHKSSAKIDWIADAFPGGEEYGK